MVPAPRYQDVQSYLNGQQPSDGGNPLFKLSNDITFFGFVFFDQNFKRDPMDDFINNLQFLHKSSGKALHFLLPGVSMFSGNTGDHSVKFGELDGIDLYYNVDAFLSFRDEFEKRIPGWEFDVGVKAVFIDISKDGGAKSLNFQSAISFDVDGMIDVGLIDRTSDLLGKIIRMKKKNQLRGAKDIKEQFERVFGINWGKGLLLAILPDAVGQLARNKAVLEGGKPLVA